MSFTITDSCNGCGACPRVCPADAISGEKKERHIIDEGLCIACGACGRICPVAAVLDGEGAVCIAEKRSKWPKPELKESDCTSCGICIDACPAGCLVLPEMPPEKGGHALPVLRYPKQCIGCGFCSLECPADALVMTEPAKEAS